MRCFRMEMGLLVLVQRQLHLRLGKLVCSWGQQAYPGDEPDEATNRIKHEGATGLPRNLKDAILISGLYRNKVEILIPLCSKRDGRLSFGDPVGFDQGSRRRSGNGDILCRGLKCRTPRSDGNCTRQRS